MKNGQAVTEAIATRTQKAQKTYGFQDNHNHQLPADHWFQHSLEGPTLFIVFYSQACRWAECLGCNLPSLMSQYHVGFAEIMQQIDYVFDCLLIPQQKEDLGKIIISNNGSILDEETFSTTALMYFLAKMNIHCPNVRVLTMESRAEYVDWAELEVLARALKEGRTPTQLELAIGFEAFDDTIRNDHFCKGLELQTFEKMAENVARHGFLLKVYFMVKPVPELSEEDAVRDVANGIAYLSRIAVRYDLAINMHLNPTYVARSTKLEEAFHAGLYAPPLLQSVARAVLAAEGKKISVFVGLNDEGLAVPGGSFIRQGDEDLINALEAFNRTQDFRSLAVAISR
ncbi:MAG: hypothetical protein KJ630_10465 [Proteobacteria bacterium]|nr:hypothetical protein [Pseudomonadota bacterium]